MLINRNEQYRLRPPATEAEWQIYHDIRRAVLREARGQGAAYDPNRCVCVQSGVAIDAVGFYERCGFHRVTPEEAGASVPMEKVL